MEDTASFWMAASRSVWDRLMEVFGEGDAGRTSRDSSKKDGRGIGCKIMLGSKTLDEASFVVSATDAASGSFCFTSRSWWGLPASWASLVASFMAARPVRY